MPAGRITGVTLSASAAGFYRELLGWRADGPTLVDDSGVAVASYVDGTEGWYPTLGGTLDGVLTAGGQVLDGGRAADPADVRFGLGTAEVPLPPPAPGRPAWFEHMSTDPAMADRFYPDAFGWEVSPAGPEYALFVADGHPVAGRLALPPELAAAIGPRWMVYVAHDDVDAGASDVDRLGGTVVVSPRDTPTGRVTAVADPGGAVFTLLTPA